MGFFSKLKNSLTGGWADVNVTAGSCKRGEQLPITVHVTVKDSDISISNVYVQLKCHEVIDMQNYQVPDRDDLPEMDEFHIQEHEELFETQVIVAPAQELPANSSHTFEGAIDIPETLPCTYSGRYSRIEWSVYAGLDMKGNDPDSGWVDIHIN